MLKAFAQQISERPFKLISMMLIWISIENIIEGFLWKMHQIKYSIDPILIQIPTAVTMKLSFQRQIVFLKRSARDEQENAMKKYQLNHSK